MQFDFSMVKDILEMMKIGDLVEILILAFLVYHIILWIRDSKAWSLLKGLVIIAVFLLLAQLFEMYTILWIAKNVMTFAITALVVVLQPELRKALEELGRTRMLSSVLLFDNSKRKTEEGFGEKTMNEITRACLEMGKVHTGALIVIEDEDSLADYERTGIDVDAIVTSQLLINIFEHNTPLHDGAVIVRNNRITSATCYLPLSDNMNLDKELGTRHRAGIGISEVTDSLTIIVSEENGQVSVAYRGKLERGLDGDGLKGWMKKVLIREDEEDNGKRRRKGRSKGKK
jgi:TIGR00159 family protein